MLKIIFERLSDWKRLPNYQLERRLDIFISMYVKELLEEKLWPLSEVIIPEFPISRKTLGETIGINQTVKVDYVLFPKDFKNPIIFLELKTDNGSVRDGQINYLVKSKAAGIETILNDWIEVYNKSASKRKYKYLFEKLDESGLTKTIWEEGKRANQNPKPKLNLLYKPNIKLAILAPDHPTGLDNFTTFNFKELINLLSKKNDGISALLGKTLQNILHDNKNEY
jgi:hypothetical protein